MHVVATNLCVWVKTLVFESLKEITQNNLRYSKPDLGIIGNNNNILTITNYK